MKKISWHQIADLRKASYTMENKSIDIITPHIISVLLVAAQLFPVH